MTASLPLRLNGWKEISSYLGRSVRTAQRWEAHFELPVRRLHGTAGATVMAYRTELDAWRDSPQGRLALADASLSSDVAPADASAVTPLPHSDNPPDPQSAAATAPVGSTRAAALVAPRSRWWTVALFIAAASTVVVLAWRGADPAPTTPLLICPDGCVVKQGETVVLRAEGADAGAAFVRWIRGENGHVESFRPVVQPDAMGTVTWGFTTDCSSRPGNYELRLVNETTRATTNTVQVRIEPEPSCGGPVADLVAEGVVLDRAAVTPGQSIMCRFTLRNQGALRAPASVARLRLGRSADRTAVTDVVLGDVEVPSILVGGTVTLQRELLVPATVPPGPDYFVWVVADNASAVIERDSTNNFARANALLVQPRGR